MWSQYDPQLVEQELREMRELGMTTTRSFLYWPDFMPTADALDEQCMTNLEHFLNAHTAQQMTTIPTFVVGHMSGQNWDPQWRNGRDIFGDIWFVGRQAWYVEQVAQRFADHPAIDAWLLTNEIPIYADWKSRAIGTVKHDHVEAWARILIHALRAGGATQPVSIGDGAWGVEVTGADNGFRIRELAPLIDFHGPHVYRMETDQVRQNLAAAFICELLDIGELPVVMEEFGVTSDYVGEESAADYIRQVLHNTLIAGAKGWLAWNNTDYDALVDSEPYSHHPFEMHFGLTDKEGRPKAQALEVRRFADLNERIGFADLYRSDAPIALIVPSYLEAQYPFTQPEDASTVFDVTRQAYVTAREADLAVAVAREKDGIPTDADLYLLPSMKQLTGPSWTALTERVRAGATVYASAFQGVHATQRGLWWPDFDSRFGVRRKTRYGLVNAVSDDVVELTFARSFGSIPEGTTLHVPVAGNPNSRAFIPLEANGAEVIAVDQHGNPALLEHTEGAGKWILSAYPFEYFASATPFVNPEDTWRVYRALAEETGTAPSVHVDDPRVLVSELDHRDGERYVWVLSQSDETVTVALESKSPLLTLDDEPTSSVELPPFGVVVLRR